MKIFKNKYFAVVLSFLLILLIPAGVLAVKNGILPEKTSGGYYSKTVNRVDFNVSATDFTLKKTADGKQTFILTADISLRKCEPDFYAIINSVEISGLNYNYVIFSPAETNASDSGPADFVLRTADKMQWTMEISVDISEKTTLTPVLQINYTSGITQSTSDEHLLSVPLNITVK